MDRRHVAAHHGPDGQVDRKAIVIPPGSFTATDPFLLLSEDWFSSPGFDWHPHRGIETVTLVLDGVLEHGDNHGHAGALEPGAVQWMTAGEGIVHRELAYRDEFAHTLQLWVNLPSSAKMAPAGYQDLRRSSHAVVSGRGSSLQVVSGRAGDAIGPAANHWPVTALVARIEPGRAAEVTVPGEDRLFAYVLRGCCLAGREEVEVAAGTVGWSDPVGPGPTSLRLAAGEADEVAEVLVCSSPPIGEQIVAYGPFVMNTKDGLAQAFEDYQAGRLGTIPADHIGS